MRSIYLILSAAAASAAACAAMAMAEIGGNARNASPIYGVTIPEGYRQ